MELQGIHKRGLALEEYMQSEKSDEGARELSQLSVHSISESSQYCCSGNREVRTDRCSRTSEMVISYLPMVRQI